MNGTVEKHDADEVKRLRMTMTRDGLMMSAEDRINLNIGFMAVRKSKNSAFESGRSSFRSLLLETTVLKKL